MSKEKKQKDLRDYINTTLIGGFLVILPFTILLIVFKWIFSIILNIIAPITQLMTFGGAVNSYLASIMAIVIIILICFGFGVLGRTTIGNYIFDEFEKKVLIKIPFYKVINETVKQISNRDRMPFSKVVLVDVFSNDTRMTGFIAEEHENGYFTVFVPTGPNPTNGFIFHVKEHQLKVIDIPVEEAIKSVIGVGTGSTNLFKNQKGSI